MFFHVNWRRLRQEKVGTIHFGMTTHTPSIQTFEMPPPVSDTASTLGVEGVTFGRADLNTTLKELWKTQEGKIYLVTARVRDIAKKCGLASHTSLYDEGCFFRQTVMPLREKAKHRVRAANWLDERSREKG
jgi:hypothetical protein